MRVVLDTDTLVAALLWNGLPARLISLWKTGKIRPCANREIIEEYLLTLACPEFNLSENEIEYLLYQEILPAFEVLRTKPNRQDNSGGLSNNKFFRCARTAGAVSIISGDHRLLSTNTYGLIRFISPADFLKHATG